MNPFKMLSRLSAAALVASAGLSAAPLLAFQEQPAVAVANPAAAAPKTPSAVSLPDWSGKLWVAALRGDPQGFDTLLAGLPAAPQSLVDSATRLREHLAKREVDRAKRIETARADLAKCLAGENTPVNLSKALVSAMEVFDLSADHDKMVSDVQIKELVTRADAAARDAEAKGEWLAASELFVRLSMLLEESGDAAKYRADSDRLGHRLGMLRLYAPKRMYELQNKRKVEADGKPLPAYNAAADDFNAKLKGINTDMVVDALAKSAWQHVKLGDMRRILTSAIDGVRTMVTTSDLREAFPNLADEDARKAMLAALDAEERAVAQAQAPGLVECEGTIKRLLAMNDQTVKISRGAFLHEFGNGGMSALDEFSAIIWPDELARFKKMTQGSFIGVGVQIEFDEASNVRVVTPLDGTPAQRAGVLADDVISKVNGTSIFGLSLDQVVDFITGPQGTPVTVTVERKPKDADKDAPRKEVEFKLVRERIEVASVKGWKRSGPGEHDWDWFIDPAAKIGYIRITQFSENTTEEFDEALHKLINDDVRGIVVDLRFNPGGLLDQAVTISQRFVNNGVIVMTRGASGTIEESKAGAGNAVLNEIPVVMLVNRGSASASEIVSGAIQHYGKRGDIKAVIMGQRSFGKGSVQKVWDLAQRRAMMKLTTQHYLLPDGRLIHREPGAKIWGVEPNLEVEMLPQQIADAITLRKNADIQPAPGAAVPAADPDDLIAKDMDLQLETGLVVLQAQAYAKAGNPAGPGK